MSTVPVPNPLLIEGTVLEDLLVILRKGPRTGRCLVGKVRAEATARRPAGSVAALYGTLEVLVESGLAIRLGVGVPEPRFSLSPRGRKVADQSLRVRQLLSAPTTTPEQLAEVRSGVQALLGACRE